MIFIETLEYIQMLSCMILNNWKYAIKLIANKVHMIMLCMWIILMILSESRLIFTNSDYYIWIAFFKNFSNKNYFVATSSDLVMSIVIGHVFMIWVLLIFFFL